MRSAREQRPRRSQPVNENRNGSLISVCLGHQEPVTSVLMFSFKLNVVPNHKKNNYKSNSRDLIYMISK